MQSLGMTNVVNFTLPQKENGYTPIANELLEKFISFDFSKRQMIVILTVARMTYGYSRKTDALSRVQISAMTNLDRAHVSRTIDELVNMNVLIKHETGRFSHGVLVNELSINKNYSQWLTDAKTAPVPKQHQCQNSTLTDAETARGLMPKEHTHKAIKTRKQLLKKTNNKTPLPIDFSISERVKVWAEKNGHTELEKHLDNFIIACEKNAYTYANWDSAFMDAIRKNWAKVEVKTTSKPDWLKV